MITELAWDSTFFKRKIGELTLSSESTPYIESELKKAREDGYQYLICRLKTQEPGLFRFLESQGFYLSDITLTWEMATAEFLHQGPKNKTLEKTPVVAAATDDIPELKALTESLFLDGRFYHDPFYSGEEADRLYQTWVENCVKGEAADIVFWVPQKGYISCRRTEDKYGDIVLIGTRAGCRGKGMGRALVMEAMQWFAGQNLPLVRVKTQLRNLNAMNFYHRLGFSIKEYEIVFAKIFGQA